MNSPKNKHSPPPLAGAQAAESSDSSSAGGKHSAAGDFSGGQVVRALHFDCHGPV